jgi:GH18 family chitinase
LEPALITNAHANGVKVLASIGGQSATSTKGFVAISASPSLRKTFANNIYNFLLANGYDGVDFDWEFPSNATEKANQNLLIQEVRNKFNSSPSPAPSWEISMAVSPGDSWGQWNDYTTLNNYVNFYNIMFYAYSGSWSSIASHNTPLYQGSSAYAEKNIAWGLKYATSTRGIPPEKINFGLHFAGQQFPTAKTLYETIPKDAFGLLYKQIAPLVGAGWTERYDAGSQVPYLTKDTGVGIISYDNPASIATKVNYALDNSGGVFVWHMSADYYAGTQPLFNSLRSAYDAWVLKH